MSHSDTDGFRILNFGNFRIRIGYGYSKNLLDMDQESKNQYPLTSAAQTSMLTPAPAPAPVRTYNIDSATCYSLKCKLRLRNHLWFAQCLRLALQPIFWAFSLEW